MRFHGRGEKISSMLYAYTLASITCLYSIIDIYIYIYNILATTRSMHNVHMDITSSYCMHTISTS